MLMIMVIMIMMMVDLFSFIIVEDQYETKSS